MAVYFVRVDLSKDTTQSNERNGKIRWRSKKKKTSNWKFARNRWNVSFEVAESDGLKRGKKRGNDETKLSQLGCCHRDFTVSKVDTKT